MQIRRFEAETTREALAAVREAFGPDALILSTRSVRTQRGRFGLSSKPIVEVTAALDRTPERSAPSPRTGRADDSWRSLQMSRALVAPLEEEFCALRKLIERGAAAPPPSASLEAEVAQLRQIARALCARVPEARAGDPESDYRAAGLSMEISQQLGAEARLRIHDGVLREEALVDALAERLEPKLATPRDDRRHCLVVGAAGVGKTTSIAKQAAGFEDPNTRLVTLDAHRVGGVESLRALSKSLGLEVDVATHADDLVRVTGKHKGRHVVDTAGRPRGDQDAIFELLQARDALGPETRVQLVVSANTKEGDLRHELAHYRCLAPESLVVNKVDDSAELGNVVNLLLEESTPPLAWIGDGQRVPEDLQVPDPHALARHVLRSCP